ncbi:MAG: hypothetical protein IJ661_04865 [Lachnospiraceae bacterium]|nr:hypothetical protein [Lachnospiraceae bacterium]
MDNPINDTYDDNIQLTINDITETMIRTGNTENGYSIIPAWVFSGNVYRENEFLTADKFAVVNALDGTIISESQSDNSIE